MCLHACTSMHISMHAIGFSFINQYEVLKTITQKMYYYPCTKLHFVT